MTRVLASSRPKPFETAIDGMLRADLDIPNGTLHDEYSPADR
jgi:hypothetical protein